MLDVLDLARIEFFAFWPD